MLRDPGFPTPPPADVCRICYTGRYAEPVFISVDERPGPHQLPRSAARAPELRDVLWDRVAVALVAKLTGAPGVTRLWLRWAPEDGHETYVVGLDGFVVERLKAIDALLPEADFPDVAYAGPHEELADDVLLAEFA